MNWRIFKIQKSLLCMFILFILFTTPDAASNNPQSSNLVLDSKKQSMITTYSAHLPISIADDEKLIGLALTEGWEGNGSTLNPFIIRGLMFNLEGANGRCLRIRNTRLSIVIRDCFFTGASQLTAGIGIYLNNVTNVWITDCIFTNNWYCINLHASNSCIIVNNTCTYNIQSDEVPVPAAIHLEDSDDNRIGNNTCSYNGVGIELLESTSNTIVNNVCNNNKFDGIYLDDSPDNVLRNNTCGYNVIGITADGIWNKLLNNTCNNNVNYGIILGGTNNTVTKNTCNTNVDFGIFIVGDSNTISNNTCTQCGEYGLEIYNALWNNVTGNTASNVSLLLSSYNTLSYNDGGFFLIDLDSSFNNLTNNTFRDQQGSWIKSADCFNNSLTWNVFLDDYPTIDYGTHTFADYNYYSHYSGSDGNGDGIGDTPHVFGAQDDHPLMFPPNFPLEWIEKPSDQYIDWDVYHRNGMGCQVIGVAYSGVDNWWINDTTNFAFNYVDSDVWGKAHFHQFEITNNTNLQIGVYYYVHVYFNDTYGHELSMIFTVAIGDWSPPWWGGLTDHILEYGESFYYALHAFDRLSDLDKWWLVDSEYFTINNEGVITNTSIVPTGAHQVVVCVNDTWGNILSGTFYVTVIDTVLPTSVVYHEIVYGEALEIRLELEDLAGIDSIWWNDTTHFIIDENYVIRNATTLNLGTYSLEVRVKDQNGNELVVFFSIAVIESSSTVTTTVTTTTTLPTTTSNPTTTGTETTSNGIETTTTSTTPTVMDSVMTLALGAGIGGAVVIVFVIIWLKKKS
jgi:parallel beta-helix repeat protein